MQPHEDQRPESKPDIEKDSLTPDPESRSTPFGRLLGSSKLPNKRLALIFVALFAVAGVYLVYRLFAATAPIATLEAETMALPSGGSVLSDSTASAGQAVRLTQVGSILTGSITLPSEATSVSVTARGSKCQGGWPTMTVLIDNNPVLSGSGVRSSSWQTIPANVTLSATNHTVSIKDTASKPCRELYIDKITFFGTTSAPSPTVSPTPTPTVTPSPTSTPTSSNPLAVRVSGNRLVDGNGTPIQLRGVNRSGTQYACRDGYGFFDGPTDATALSAIKAWGANAVRVSLNEDCWLALHGSPGTYSGLNYQNAMKAYVGRLNAQGLRVILDLHWNSPDDATLANAQQTMPDRAHSPAFWNSVATVFKDNPSVMFDLYNEPHPDSNRNTTAAWTCVRDGGTCPGVSFTAAGSQELVNSIRSTGSTNVVMVGGPQYAGVVNLWTTYKPNDPLGQLAASIHIYYVDPDYPTDPNKWEWSPCDLQSCWTNTMAPLATTTPIVMGEIGEHDCTFKYLDGSALSQANLLDWADQHGISYLGWSWLAKNGDNCVVEPSLVKDYNGTPTDYGIGIRDHFLSLPH